MVKILCQIVNFLIGSSSNPALYPSIHHQRSSAQRERAERVFKLSGYRWQVSDHRQHEGLPHRQRPIHVSVASYVQNQQEISTLDTKCDDKN